MKRLPLLFLTLLLFASTTAQAEGMRVIRDAEIESGLKVMCTSVFEQAGVSPDAVRFVLVEDDTLNAFVAGGQNIFLNTGLILKTKNAPELIGVVAHETGHIALGHLFRSQETMSEMSYQAILANVLGIAAGIAARSGNAAMAVAGAGQGMAINNYLSHNRTQEASADQAGTRFLEQAGLPSTGFLSFMETMKGQELLPDTAQSPYVRTHPLTQERIDFLENVVQKRDKTGRAGSVPEAWNTLHSRLRAKLLGYLDPNTALRDRSETGDAQYARAIAFYRKGQTEQALGLLDKLILVEPQNAWLYELKGQILFEAGRAQDSLAPYARSVALAPKAGLVRIAYAHALLEAPAASQKPLEEAVRQLTLSLDTETHAPDAHYFLAMAYGKMGNEGLSRLHLAKQYAMENKAELANREAHLALKFLPPRSPARLQAEDILASTDKKKDGKDKGEEKERRRD